MSHPCVRRRFRVAGGALLFLTLSIGLPFSTLAMQSTCDADSGGDGILPGQLTDDSAFIDITDRLGDKGLTTGWSGMAAFDADNDGDIDLVVTSGPGQANRLFRNDGDAAFTDIGEAAGIAMTPDFSMACGVGDFNNDGRLDLLVGRQKLGVPSSCVCGPALFLNDSVNGEGIVQFRETTPEETGLTSEAPAAAFGVADLDNDGLLDLVIGRYDLLATHGLQVPIYDSQPNELWRCTGIEDNVPKFERITTAGIEGTRQAGQSPGTADERFIPGTFALYMSDVDDDGLVDFFTLHDIPGNVDYFHNEGNLRFIRLQTDVLDAQGGWMGITGGDYDSDGDIDYFLTNVGSDFDTSLILPGTVGHAHLNPTGAVFHKLLRNDGGVLVDATAETDVTPSSVLPPVNLNMGAGLEGYEFGFGATWIDADNRGMLDLYWAGDLIGEIASTLRLDSHGVGRFLTNNGDGSFTDRTAERGLLNIRPTRAVAFGRNDAARAVAACDLNGDGFQDIALTNGGLYGLSEGATRVFLNPANSGGHWLKVRVRGRSTNRFGVGIKVKITIGDNSQAAEVVTTTSAFTGVQPEIHFGVGEATSIDRLRVQWPRGHVTDLTSVPVDQVLTLDERDSFFPYD